MTIKEYAKEQGISTQAVYQRLKKNRVKVESVTEKGTGEITAEGVVILNKLFDPENRQTKPAKDEQIEAMSAQISELRETLARKEERIESLESALKEAREDVKYWQQAFTKEQEIHSLLLRVLPAPQEQEQSETPKPGGGSEKRGFWARLTGKK